MSTALRYPRAGDRPWITLFVGALLSAVGLLLVPAVVVAGYYGRVLARSATDSDGPPGFGDWRALAAHGAKTWSLTLLCVGVAGVLAIAFGVLAMVVGDVVGNGTGQTVGALAYLLVGAGAIGVVSLPLWFFVPVALTRLALSGRTADALALRTVFRTATSRAYLRQWVRGAALVVVGTVVYGGLTLGVSLPVVGDPAVALGLTSVPFGGHVAGAGVNFYCQVAAFRLFGRGYAAAVRESDHDPLLAETKAEMGVDRSAAWTDERGDDSWGHSGDRPAWGELRRSAADD